MTTPVSSTFQLNVTNINGAYHCPGLNVNVLSSTFKQSPLTVSDS